MTSYALPKKKTWPVSMASFETHLELLQRISAGDEFALRELYEAYGRRLYAYALRLTGEPALAEERWGFVQEDTFASRGQKMIYHGPLKPFEHLLLRSPIVPWSYFASNFYHNVYWYPFVGRPRVEAALATKWGQLFRKYGDGSVVMPGMEPRSALIAAGGLVAGLGLIGWLLGRGRGDRQPAADQP